MEGMAANRAGNGELAMLMTRFQMMGVEMELIITYLNNITVTEIFQSHEILCLTKTVQVPAAESECTKVVVDGPK
jgi:hypothetical protein